MAKYLDSTGLTYFWNKIKNWVKSYVVLSNGTLTVGTNSITPVENAYGLVKVGNTTVSASGTDTLKFDISAGAAVLSILAQEGTSGNPDKISIGIDKDLSKYDNGTSGFITSADIPAGVQPYTSSDGTMKMDGTASHGSSTKYAKGDHVHPSDTSKANVSEMSVVAGTGTDADKTTITLKTGTSATVLTAHQDISGKANSATTLAGYGITDAKINNGTITLGSETITPLTSHLDISGKANKSEMSVVAGTGANADKTTITLKTGTSATVLTAHLDISGKADKSSTVSNVAYDTTNHKITKTINGSTTDVVTAATIVTDGGAILSTTKGAANGVCPLDSTAKIDPSYLPSYVDDVVEAYARTGQTELSSNWLASGSASGTVITPQAGVIYVLMNSSTSYTENSEFRWGGTTYVRLNDSGCSAMSTAEIDAATDLTPNPS